MISALLFVPVDIDTRTMYSSVNKFHLDTRHNKDLEYKIYPGYDGCPLEAGGTSPEFPFFIISSGEFPENFRQNSTYP